MLGYPFDVMDILRRSEPPAPLSGARRRRRAPGRLARIVVVLVLLGFVSVAAAALAIADATYGGDPVGAIADPPRTVTADDSERSTSTSP